MELFGRVEEAYADFAASAEDSPCFRDWAGSVVGDEQVRAWIARLSTLKRQPNLVFAAARWHGVPAPGPYAGLRDALLSDDGTIVATIMRRRTQTNEVGRLATLLPAIWRVAREAGGPLALLEVGASAGLCLYPDRWAYRYLTEAGPVDVGGGPDAAGVLTCRLTGELPAVGVPPVAWRGGIDLNPLDVTDEDAMAWLLTLVWPEQVERRERLRTAIGVARADPPDLERGDLVARLRDRVAEAGRNGPVLVFHSAVLAYLDEGERTAYRSVVDDLVAAGACRWISNEGATVLPEVTATGPPVPDSMPTFVLGLDGRALAWTHGHGRSMTWL